MSADVPAAVPLLVPSPVESARFGLRVGRGEMPEFDPQALRRAWEACGFDVAIVRIPAEALARVPAVEPPAKVIVADTLVHYARALREGPPLAPASAAVRLVPAAPSDRARIAGLARAAFAGYVSHYSANPGFAAGAVVEGYAEWAAAHLDADPEATRCWIVQEDGKDAGFSCCRLAADRAVGVLNGILPAARRRGVYRNMLRAMLASFRDDGLSRFEISTQVHNYAVQRTWTTEGLTLLKAENTLHFVR